MALPRLDYQQPDYLGQIGQGVDAAAKVAHDLTPAHPLVQKYLKRVLNGEMTPQQAAVMARLEHGGHIPGDQPGASPVAGAPQAPGMSPSQPPTTGGGFTGPREFTGPEETVTAPRQQAPQAPPQSSGDLGDLDDTPILNRDVPELTKLAQTKMADPYRAYQLQLEAQRLGQGDRRLTQQDNQFNQLMPGREANRQRAIAEMKNIPVKNQLAGERNKIAWANVGLGQHRLENTESEQYLKGTNDVATPIAQIDGLLNTVSTRPDIAPPAGDYRVRREAEILNQLHGFGVPQAFSTMMKSVADAELTPDQRAFRRQARAIVMGIQHATFGARLTGPEMELMNGIAGEQWGVEDTMAGLSALKKSMGARVQRYKQAFPGAAQRIPDVNPNDVTPDFSRPDYPSGFGGPENIGSPQEPEGPSLQEEIQSAPQNQPRLRGTVTNEGIR